MKSQNPQLLSLFLLAFTNAGSIAVFCPAGWTWRPNTPDCFKRTTRLDTWKAAESQCNRWGGHLASIHSESEQRFIVSLFNGTKVELFSRDVYFWIGLKKYENDFFWSDGSILNYTNWYQGKPKRNIDGVINCVEIWDRKSWKWDALSW